MKRLTKFDHKMFKKARKIAETSTYKTHNLGCVIVYKHHIIGQAANSNKTHPNQKYYNKRYRTFNKSIKPILDSAHAEINALSKISYPIAQEIDWAKARVYIYRISPGRESRKGLARPCNACLHALRDRGIRHIYYTTDTGFCYEFLEG